jgi:hypothetical protein
MPAEDDLAGDNMAQYHEETLLIITKTYPSPSRKYRETSCVAAINQDGEMRRLFPIPFRLLDGDMQFKRWEWVKARISKASDDHRPESFKVDIDSIDRIQRMGTDQGWAERMQWIAPHFLQNYDSLESRRQTTGQTLGFIRPIEFTLIIKPSDKPDWSPDEKAKLIQDGLFDSTALRTMLPLKKVPFDFYYSYTCQTPAKQQLYKHKLTDWEVDALYWNCQRDYGQNWEKYFRLRLESDFSEKKEIAFLMGTMHRFPDQWLIVGLVYPPKMDARQQSLFLTPPGD